MTPLLAGGAHVLGHVGRLGDNRRSKSIHQPGGDDGPDPLSSRDTYVDGECDGPAPREAVRHTPALAKRERPSARRRRACRGRKAADDPAGSAGTRSPEAADLSMASMTSWRWTASAKSGTV